MAIEYHIPQSSKRIDFILSGKDQNQRDTAVLIELKQWQEAQITEKDAVVVTRFKHGEKETTHPLTKPGHINDCSKILTNC